MRESVRRHATSTADCLFMLNSDSDVVQSYLRWFTTRSDEDLWACEEVNRRVIDANSPHDAWALTLALVAAAEEEALEYVGAGPLEDFVRCFGRSHIEDIEVAARTDPKFCRCLGRIWLGQDDLPPDVLARVVEASLGWIRPLRQAGA